MKKLLTLFAVFALTAPVFAADPNVIVTCEHEGDGVVRVDYALEDPGGSLMRGISLDITVDGGATIDAISDYLTGNPDRPPIGTGMAALPDFTSNPYHSATAILSAIHYRNRTGKGQFIEVAQAESTVCWTETSILDYTVNKHIQMGMRNRLPYAAPHGVYRCLGEDREVDYCAMPESVPEHRRKDDRWCA